MQCLRRAVPHKSLLTKSSLRYHSVELHKTVLENGVKIVCGGNTDDTLGTAGVYVGVGSAFETQATHGCAHYLRRNLYKSTNRISGLRLTRTIESITGSLTAENKPEYLVYKATFPKEQTENTLAVMADVLRPRLAEWEFRDVRNLVRHDVNENNACKENVVLDAVRRTAFGGEGLGRAALCPSYNINQIYPDNLAEYILGRVCGSNITVVGNAKDPDQFANAVAAAFGELPKTAEVSLPEPATSNYVGGTNFVIDGPGSCYVEAYKGAPAFTKEAIAQQLLAEILGFYSTTNCEAGDDIDSRLATSLASVDANEGRAFIFDDSQTVFGVGASSSRPCRELAEVVHEQLSNLSNVTEEEFNAALRRSSVRAQFAADNRLSVLDALYLGDKGAAPTVTLNDVKEAAKNLLASKPTIYASGDLTNMPSFTH